MPVTNLYDLPQERLIAWCRAQGQPDYRGRQLFAWLYRPGVTSFQAMTDLPRTWREELAATASLALPRIETTLRSRDGTRKFALRLADNLLVEMVLIPEADRQTLCVSSQVGCAMGCVFCATGGLGFRRSLAVHEIVGQVVRARTLVAEEKGPPLTNLVFMGMGEPLANLEAVLPALAILTDQRGLDFSPRRVTVSTAGLAPRLAVLGAAQPKINLAISLHAADDATRDRLMPINRTYPIGVLLDAVRAFPLPPRKRVMIEYILIAGVNDREEDARRLARLLHGLRVKINLLPCNPNPQADLQPPSPERVAAFQQTLMAKGYTVLVRDSRGQDIDGACGQLAGRLAATTDGTAGPDATTGV